MPKAPAREMFNINALINTPTSNMLASGIKSGAG
jgi:hypothetical protein